MRKNIKVDAQELWLRKQGRKFISDRIRNAALLLLLTVCAFVVAWVEVPY